MIIGLHFTGQDSDLKVAPDTNWTFELCLEGSSSKDINLLLLNNTEVKRRSLLQQLVKGKGISRFCCSGFCLMDHHNTYKFF